MGTECTPTCRAASAAADAPLPPQRDVTRRYLGKYEGQFLNGCMDGSGVYLWAEGDV
jgi:hypothetical protein